MRKLFLLLIFLFFTSFISAQWIQFRIPNGQYAQSLFVSNNNIFAGVYPGKGIYKSSDFGENWQYVGINGKTINSFINSGSNIIAATGGLYKSSDNGSNWIAFALTTALIRSMVSTGSTVYAAGSEVFKSTDYGTSWESIGLSGKNIYAFTILDSNLFAGIAGSPMTGIYKSTNNGINWYTSNYGLTNLDVRTLISSGDNIFAGTFGGGIFKSTNHGISWMTANTGLSNLNITSFTSYGANLFVGTGSGIYLSTNNGINWINKNQGFLQTKVVFSMSIGNNYIYIGTNDTSVWRRSLSEIIGVQKISTKIPEKFILKQNYPNPFNPATNIRYQIAKSSYVTLRIFDLQGKEVETLVSEKQSPGTYEVSWNAENYPSGVYFYVLNANDYKKSLKMLLIK